MARVTFNVFVLVCAVVQAFPAQAFQTQAFFPMMGHQNQDQNPAQPQGAFHFQMRHGHEQAEHTGAMQGHHAPHSWWQGGLNGMRTGLQGLTNGLQSTVHMIAIHPMYLHMIYRTQANFYDGCGTALRHCEWRPKPIMKKVTMMMSKLTGAYTDKEEEHAEEPQPQQPELEQVCSVTKFRCVGNTELCVTRKDCDMALRITERSVEGKPEYTKVLAVSTLDRCQWDDQSVGDEASAAQRFFGVGLAAYDDDQKLTCRALKASDFKLIFLQKNAPEGDGPVCKHKADNDMSTVGNAHIGITRGILSWPTTCKALESSEDGTFSMKSFLKNHVTSARYTSFFSPPFDFADEMEYRSSDSGMVITAAQ